MSKKKNSIKSRTVPINHPAKDASVSAVKRPKAKELSQTEKATKRNFLYPLISFLWGCSILFLTGCICTAFGVNAAKYLFNIWPHAYVPESVMMISVLLFIAIIKAVDGLATKKRWIERLSGYSKP